MFGHDQLQSLGLVIDEHYRALICKPCKRAITAGKASTHLWEKHAIPKQLRSGLTIYLQSRQLIDPVQLPLLPLESSAHPDLQVDRVYACQLCGWFSSSIDLMRRHLSSEHCKRAKGALEKYSRVELRQSWLSVTSARSWTVEPTSTVTSAAPTFPTFQLWEMHNQERSLLAEEAVGRVADPSDTGLDVLELTRSWMNRTKWAEVYRGCRRDVLFRLIQIGDASFHNRDVTLGAHAGKELVSPLSDERKIWALFSAVDTLFDRCDETMRRTGRPILCWLRSAWAGEFRPEPFTEVSREATRKRYRRPWKSFIALIFRMYQMDPADIQSMFGIRLSGAQVEWLRQVWEDGCWDALSRGQELGAAVAASDPDLERDDMTDVSSDEEDAYDSSDEINCYEKDVGTREQSAECSSHQMRRYPRNGAHREQGVSSQRTRTHDIGPEELGVRPCKESAKAQADAAIARLSELTFRLFILFSEEEFIDGQPHSSLLVYFSGILGFRDEGKTFRRAKEHTPHLSGLIYQQRLLFLEYALPYRAYDHITLAQRPRGDQLTRLNNIRSKYMVHGCMSPLAEFLSLRDYGRVIARTDPPAFMFRWSDDGQSIHYDNVCITLQQFRTFAHKILTQAELVCARLMYDWKPHVSLKSIKDDLRNTANGFSFIQHPGNDLVDAYLELSARACSNTHDPLLANDTWNINAISRYLKLKEELLELILALLYVVGGQCPRGTELFSIEQCNSPSTERGIYIHNGYVISVTRYHKARKATNREFNVVRYLPARAGNIVYYYLVYISRFSAMLHRRAHLQRSDDWTSLLFFSESAPRRLWRSHKLSSILKRLGSGIFEKPFGIQLYRQISACITEKHIKTLAQPFNRHDDKSTQANLSVVLDWQRSHRPLQQSINYGLDGAFPTRLQPALLNVYEWASNQWHQFLSLDETCSSPYREATGIASSNNLSTKVPAAKPRMEKHSASEGSAVSRRPTKRVRIAAEDIDESESSLRGTREAELTYGNQAALSTSITDHHSQQETRQAKRLCKRSLDSANSKQASRSLHSEIAIVARQLSGGDEKKWFTWQANDFREFPADRLLHHLWQFSSRCSLCYLRGQNNNGHSLPICWAFGANDIRKDQDDLYLQIKQHHTKQTLNWCLQCGLPMQWHQPGRIGDQIIRAGIFGPVCMFSGIIVEAIAVFLTDNTFLWCLRAWEKENGRSILGNLKEWLGTTMVWAGLPVPIMTKAFYQLAEFAEYCDKTSILLPTK